MNAKKCPLEIAASLADYWSPRVIAEVDEYYVKVAKLKGALLARPIHGGDTRKY